MALELNNAQLCHRELSQDQDELIEIRKKISNYRDNLEACWAGDDEKLVESAIYNIEYKLNRVITDLEELAHDLLVYGHNMQEQMDSNMFRNED